MWPQRPPCPGPLRTRGPVTVSVADARVREAAGATLDFAVSLSRAAPATVVVAYVTADGSASAGSDYTARIRLAQFHLSVSAASPSGIPYVARRS